VKVKGIGSGRNIEIIAKNNYTPEELIELFQTQGNFPTGAPNMRKVIGISSIDFPGEGGFTNMVTVRKNKINISQGKTSAKQIGKTMALDMLTSNWNTLLNAEGKKNEAIMDAIGQEIERLVG
jgi:phosphotransferase system HPr-like phosphotransfer protein